MTGLDPQVLAILSASILEAARGLPGVLLWHGLGVTLALLVLMACTYVRKR